MLKIMWCAVALFMAGLPAFPQDSLNIRRVAELSLARGYLNGAAVQGGYLFVGTGGDEAVEGLWVVDVRDPHHPDSVAFDTVSLAGNALEIALTDSLAIIASAQEQVHICSIGNPLAPHVISTVGEGQGFVWDVAVQGHYIYSARYTPRGLSVADIADPAHPQITGFAAIADDPSGLCMAGNYAHVTAGLGLYVVDISNPQSPAAVAVVPDTGATQVAIWGDYAYVTNYSGTLSVVDVSDPPAAHRIARVQTGGYTDGVAAADDHVFVAAGEGGLQIYDVRDPSSPTLSGYYRLAPWPAKLTVNPPYAYVTSDEHLLIYDCSQALGAKDRGFIPHPYALSLSAYPNPFNPSTTLSFSLPKAGNVKLEVFDVTGRLVTTLADERFEAGEHTLRFDGSALPSGVYFARVHTGDVSQTQKLLLLK